MTSYSSTIEPSEYPAILERAADILESEVVGWCKGRYFNGLAERPPVSACALGAIRIAVAETRHRDTPMVTVELTEYSWITMTEVAIGDRLQEYMDKNVVHPVGDPHWDGIHELNDMEEVTKEQVIEVMKGAAKEWRNNANE